LRTERSYRVHTRSTADRGDMTPECFRDLDGERSDSARRAGDENAIAFAQPSDVAQTLERREAGDGKGRGFLEGELGRLVSEADRRGARIFGTAALANPEDRLPLLEIRDARADRRDYAGEIVTQYRRLGTAPSGHEPSGQRPATQEGEIGDVDGRSANGDQDLAGRRNGGGRRDINDSNGVREVAVRNAHRGFHRAQGRTEILTARLGNSFACSSCSRTMTPTSGRSDMI